MRSFTTLSLNPQALSFEPRRPRFRAAIVSSCLVLGMAASDVPAVLVYESAALEFSTTNQSMWGSGDAFVAADMVFVGAQWTNRTVGVGGFVGSLQTVTVNTNPLWWAWKGCKETIDFLCGSEPAKGQVSEVVDTRTGARVDLTTSGKFGLEFGYTVNSGSVDAEVEFKANALLPGKNVQKLEYFALNPSSSLTDGSIASQSPYAEAYMNAIAQLSGSVTAQACLILTGCTDPGTAQLPTLNVNQPLLSIDPGSLKVLPDLLPGPTPDDPKLPLAEVKILDQALTAKAAYDTVAQVPGFKLTTPQFTLVDTTPPTPDITIDLASLEMKFPVINTTGEQDGTVIKSSGRTDFATLTIDLDALATAVSSGGIPPLGLGLDIIDKGGFKVGLQIDALDVDAGPVLGITQDFELNPTLMVDFAFDNPVMIGGLAGPQTAWSGAWKDLPVIALLKTTTFSPTFWIDAMLTNALGLDLGLVGTMDILKFAFEAAVGDVTILGTSPISLNTLLGLGNQLFSTPKLQFPIWGADDPFALDGFQRLTGTPFTITVPEPGSAALVLAGLVGGSLLWRRRRHGGLPLREAA